MDVHMFERDRERARKNAMGSLLSQTHIHRRGRKREESTKDKEERQTQKRMTND
jgi:hypothetical protein